MKKAIVFALLVALVVTLAVPAFAAGKKSPTGTVADLLPDIVKDFIEDIVLIAADAFEKLPEEIQEIIKEAMEKLQEVIPDGMLVKYFFYVDIPDDMESATVDFEMENFEDLAVKQFEDHKWEDRKVTINKNRTATVEGIVDGPMAFFVK